MFWASSPGYVEIILALLTKVVAIYVSFASVYVRRSGLGRFFSFRLILASEFLTDSRYACMNYLNNSSVEGRLGVGVPVWLRTVAASLPVVETLSTRPPAGIFAGPLAAPVSLSGLPAELALGLQGLWQELWQAQEPGAIAKYENKKWQKIVTDFSKLAG